MQRPVYETPASISAEEAFADTICKCWSTSAHRTEQFVRFDYLLRWNTEPLHGQPMCLLEMKIRNCTSNTYETLIISRGKLNALAPPRHTENRVLPHLLVVRYRDRDVYCVIDSELLRVCTYAQGGRRDRGDPHDIEEVAHIPLDYFTDISPLSDNGAPTSGTYQSTLS